MLTRTEKNKNLHKILKERSADEFISYLHKELVELMYNNKLSSEHMNVYHKIIAKWKENENITNNYSDNSNNI